MGLILILLFLTSAAAQTPLHTTSAKDRQSVNVTVYNSNIALVRETRNLTLPSGRVALRFSDVASLIRPETFTWRRFLASARADPGTKLSV